MLVRKRTLCLGAIGLVAMSLAASAAHAVVVLPPAASTATFSGFREPAPVGILHCDKTFAGAGTAACSGPTFYAGGSLGPGVHVFGSNHGKVTITGGASPTARVDVDLSGGDAEAGAGSAQAEATLDYYFTVLSFAPPPTAVFDVPLSFTDSGSLTNTIPSNFGVSGSISTVLNSFTGAGGITVGSSVFLQDIRSGGADGHSFTPSYGSTHEVDFHFGLGFTPIAHVNLDAECDVFEEALPFGSGDCTAIADPHVGFDQGAFDRLMGDKTFKLSDYFEIVTSSGLAGGGVPEPGSWTLMIAGFGLAGAALRRRARLPA
jgi:hypothetical protein